MINKVKNEINKNIKNLQDINLISKNPIEINNNKPIFIQNNIENLQEGIITYLKLDRYGRVTGAITKLSHQTLSIIESNERELYYEPPKNWWEIQHTKQKNDDNEDTIAREIFEKCHIIGYSLLAKFTNSQNMFIGTNDLNTSAMKKVENDVRKHIENNVNDVIIYEVTLWYKEKDDKIPIGILIQAEGMNKDLGFRKCNFCYNIEKNIIVDYKTGKAKVIDKRKTRLYKLSAKELKEKKFEDENRKLKDDKNDGEYKKYSININEKQYHLYNKDNLCEEILKNELILNETKTKEEILIKKGYSPCHKCNCKKY